MNIFNRISLIIALLLLVIMPLSAQETTAEPESTAEAQPVNVPLIVPADGLIAYYVPRLIAEYPHDTSSYIQGLLLYEDVFYESGGEYGLSTLREVDPKTGEVLRMIDIPAEYFAEGLALVDDRLIQLTWLEGTAFVYDRETFELLDTFSYETEGWGLCYDGEALWMSDGSANIYQRDPETFELLATIPVTYFGAPQRQLNELECVGDHVLANLYYGDATQYFIVAIDKTNGNIVALIDARELPSPETLSPLLNDERFNGIAYDARDNTLWLTGKHWDTMYHVELELLGYLEPEANSD